jgi:CTP:molybdopterin cytidylyltransferase MocA
MDRGDNATRVAGLILAAGAGSRLGQPKALLRLGDELLLDRAVWTLGQAGCAPVVVVLGASAQEAAAAISSTGVEIVPNPDWATGMGSSLRAGLASLTGRADAAVVSLVDQPGVTAATVERLVAAWRADGRAAVATYGGAPRNPVLLPAATWAQAAASAVGDQGARAWLRAHPGRVSEVACDDVGSADDIDTPADLRRFTTG